MKGIAFCLRVSLAALLFFAGSALAQGSQPAPYQGQELETKVKNVNGTDYVFTKYRDKKGAIKAIAYDLKGNIVSVEQASQKSGLYGKSLEKILASRPRSSGLS